MNTTKDRNKRNRSSGSDPQYKVLVNSKKHKQNSVENSSVSEILYQTNNILYGSDDELDNSVFQDTDNKHPTTPPSTNKQPKTMASNNVHKNKDKIAEQDVGVSAKLDTLIQSIQDLKTNQESIKRMFESKLDKLKVDLIASVDTKIKALHDDITLDINRETTRIDQLFDTVKSIQSRVDSLEQSSQSANARLENDSNESPEVQMQRPLDNHDLTITASGIPTTPSEDLILKAENLIRALGDDVARSVSITDATRLPTRFAERPGIVKISFRSAEEKILVLRNKMKLKDNIQFKKVYLKSSKSRVERLIENNARTILRSLPEETARSLRVDASGRIKPRNLRQNTQHSEHE